MEDIGLADPRAIQMAMDAWETFDRLGAPEGELALAQLTIYLASTAKSNAAYKAWNAARKDVPPSTVIPKEVPLHIRNAHQADEVAGLRQRLPVRPRCGRRCGGANRVSRCHGRARVLPTVPRGLNQAEKEKLDTLRAARTQTRSA